MQTKQQPDSESCETPTAVFEPWFERGPAGRPRTTSTEARSTLESFARSVRDALGGSAFHVERWPYRYAGATWWAFDADGPAGGVSLTFVETGKTLMPAGSPTDATGEVADAVDAHYLFELFERELSPSA